MGDTHPQTDPVSDDGWLTTALRRDSGHWDPRPPGSPIDLLVIHNISLPPGERGGPYLDDLFMGTLDFDAHPYFAAVVRPGGRVSTHLLIRRDGEVRQYVSFAHRAWHAGRSSFAGRAECNDYSIGIELEGDDHSPFEPAQYTALVRATLAIQARYPAITSGRIAGHSDVAPGRKTDPGPYFDWALYRGRLRQPR
jgi:AmpD protein